MGKLPLLVGVTLRCAALAPGAVAARLRHRSPGQGMVEYALMLMLVAMVIVVVLGVLGGHVSHLYSNIANGIPG